MNKSLTISTLLILSLILVGCSSKYKDGKHVLIQTTEGDIIVKLYDATPKHRDNFLKLAENGFYDGLIFHRVIKDFVIQSGDPDTRKVEAGKIYGDKDAGYLIDPEFVDTILHKKGVIAMARENDYVNPGKKSSSSQFYIVVGKLYTPEQLKDLEKSLNNKLRDKIHSKVYDSLFQNQQYDNETFDSLRKKANRIIDSITLHDQIKFSEQQRKIYTTFGGIPHLDGNYTIFGEVVEGIEVVEKISQINTDKNDRPVKDIEIKVRILK